MVRPVRLVLNVVSALITVGLLALFIGHLISISGQYERDARLESDLIEQRRGREATTCAKLPRSEQLGCVRQLAEKARESQRAEQELGAQKVTAWWTLVMGVSSLVAMIVSTVGVYLVYRTFAEQRAATAIARSEAAAASAEAAKALAIAARNADAAERQVLISETNSKKSLRPYLAMKNGKLEIDLAAGTVVAEIFFNNTGRTPAYRCDFAGSIHAMDPVKAAIALAESDRSFSGGPILISINGGSSLRFLAHGRITPNDYNRILRDELALIILGIIRYTDTFADEWRTEFCFALTGAELRAIKNQAVSEGKHPQIEWPATSYHNEIT